MGNSGEVVPLSDNEIEQDVAVIDDTPIGESTFTKDKEESNNVDEEQEEQQEKIEENSNEDEKEQEKRNEEKSVEQQKQTEQKEELEKKTPKQTEKQLVSNKETNTKSTETKKKETPKKDSYENKEDLIKEQKEEKETIIAEDNASKEEKDKYLTDPVPKGKPEPVEWQDVTVDNEKKLTATLSVTAKTILNNMHLFNQDKLEVLPSDGVIYPKQTVVFNEGESVFDVLLREMKNNGIHLEFEMTPIYNSHYIEGINNLYEFDCGELSGWMYKVNGWFPNYGASRYELKDKDTIDWVFTCDLGRDIGGGSGSIGGAG
ncbi:DUF4430 domain-containing protein [bacterium LRH843]|nr:DUF4430 domain-containing protein [bacterium LRH843]